MIELKNVSYEYENNSPVKTRALKNVSITVHHGEFWGIIGHTGSGKSTLVELMSGLIKPESGSVVIGGVDVCKAKSPVKETRGKVGMVFQYPEHQLFEETVMEDVCFGPKNLGFDENECKQLAREAMALVGLGEEYESRSPFELSGGEKRRVAIASILAMKPEVLILDEPTAGLDPAGRDFLLDTLVKLRGNWCKSVVLVSHSMEDVAMCCDKVLVLNDGEVLLSGGVREVFAKSEVLTDAGLDIPQVTRLVERLNSLGFDFDKNILSVDEAVEAIYNRLKERG